MKRNNRKDIDKFLINLEMFITKYHKHTDDVYEIENTFIPLFKANKNSRSYVDPNKTGLDVPNIAMLCNPYKIGFTKQNDKSNLSSKFKRNRTTTFVQSVAYGLEYKLVKDVSYEHIFMKHLIKNSEKAFVYIQPKNFSDYLLNYDLKEFLVPAEYDTNDNLIIY